MTNDLILKPEILAPAGDPEALSAALRFGADAVYVGAQQFGMRTSPKNFDEVTLPMAVQEAHALGKKLYLTCNVLPVSHRSLSCRISSALHRAQE